MDDSGATALFELYLTPSGGTRHAKVLAGLLHLAVGDLAVIDDPGHFGAEILAVDDAVHEAVLEQELAGLEPLGQFEPDGVLDRPLACEADHRPRFGQRDIALERPTG